MHDQIVFCTFHSFSVEVQMNAGWLLTPNTCIRLELQAPPVAHIYTMSIVRNPRVLVQKVYKLETQKQSGI